RTRLRDTDPRSNQHLDAAVHHGLVAAGPEAALAAVPEAEVAAEEVAAASSCRHRRRSGP
ncbi:hypothetical protein, partial [Mycobacterium sp. 1423905.2]|uniref:hypothetical protein n=1 Tax=Mycobacterium sp. 1423905.2 TaxID=1856859 RepID=UPI001C12B66E